MAAVASERLRVRHGEELSEEYTCRIPKTDAEILRFFLCFLADQGLSDVPVFINGGYVRDLLLGKEPDDLDLTLCLRDCAPEVTVAALLDEMKPYVEQRPEFGLTEFKNATILSNESKDKQLDTFKAHFTNTAGVKTEVDVMPTIGEETYSDHNRVPVRDQRGLPEEDALRRDLTIGALLMRVRSSESSTALRYELFDFYGGVTDIERGVLRSPCPVDRKPAEVEEAVLRTPEEKELAKSLGIHDLPPDEAVQVLWWSKVLIDDPLRICRALRFAAKFKFKLHPAFWKAAPFALEPLRTKVAGSRKFTEYQKIGGYGFKACFEFFELAFSYTFGPGEGCSRLASALLGGQDDKAKPRMLSQVHTFDRDCFRTLADAVQLCEGQKHDGVELLGELMVAAIAAAQFEADGDPVAEFTTACDGMCVSNAMREAGLTPLNASIAMAAEAPSLNALDIHVADACGISLDSLGRHVQVWEAMQICNSRTGPEYATPYRRQLALALVRLRAPDMAAEVQACFEALSFSRPPVRGTVLNAKGVLEVPPPLRRQVMLLFEVSTRVLKYAAPVEAGESLQQLFDAHPKLRQAFSSSVWMAEDGKTLKREFQPPKRGGAKDAKRPKATA